ncbi:MAG TPA: hypothetical protein VKF62_02350, partial [Planctomycetota bacterium]|nr:hypothetical protein [Planctomycetota bacterium]
MTRKPRGRGAAVRAGPQRRILETLRQRGPRTAHELTTLLGGGRAAMGAHLRHLLAASLLAYEEEKRPLGRPARRYRLTPEADALFTKQYELLAIRMTEALSRMGKTSLDEILARWREELVGYFEARLPGEGTARLAALAEHQSRFGFMASV